MRLIDADANIETMKKCAENPENAQALLCYRYAQRILEEAPTVDAAPRWHRVEDGLPEESKEYNVYLKMGTGVEAPDFFGKRDLSYVTSMYFKKEQKLWFDEYDEPYNADLSLVDTVNDYHVTHWMPLPEPPKEVTNE